MGEEFKNSKISKKPAFRAEFFVEIGLKI